MNKQVLRILEIYICKLYTLGHIHNTLKKVMRDVNISVMDS